MFNFTNMRFWAIEILTVGHFSIYRNVMMGEVKSPKLRFWYHVCIHIDLHNGTVAAAVNGHTFRSEEGK